MKNIKRTISIFLATAMILAMCVPAFAAYKQLYKTNIIDLPQKEFVNAKPYQETYDDATDTSTDTFDMYRIKVPGDGYVKLYTGGGKEASIFKTFTKNADIDLQEPLMDVGGSTNNYLVLPKGTYYLHANDSMKLRWVFAAKESGQDYCRANAKSFSANKDRICIFPYDREHAHYYKIKVTTKKLCTFTLTRMDTELATDAIDFVVLDGKGKLVAQPASGAVTCSKTLPAGTYYVKVFRNDDESDDDYYYGRLAKIRWQ